MALLFFPLPLSSSAAVGWPAAQSEGRKQSKQIGDYPLLPGGGDLVRSLSSILALLSRPLGSSSATKFSWPAAQHPLWAGLRRRRQKAEQADRGLVLSLSSGLALLSPPLSSSSATKFSRPAAQHPRPFGLACGAEGRKQEADRGLPPPSGVCVCDLVLSRCCIYCLLPAAYCLVHAACNKR